MTLQATSPAATRPLEGTVALVTGGSRGIGAAVARRLSADGAAVALTYRASAHAARELAAELSAGGARAVALPVDSLDPGQVDALPGEVVRRLGRLDVLVNNAGIVSASPLTDITDADLDAMLTVNVRSVFALARGAARVMADGGRIVNIGSIWAGAVPLAGISAYAASKAALVGATRAWARDLGPRGITVNVVHPGPTDTDMNPADGPWSGFNTPRTALARYGHPHEVADAVAYLASPAAAWVTGSELTVDGGYNA